MPGMGVIATPQSVPLVTASSSLTRLGLFLVGALDYHLLGFFSSVVGFVVSVYTKMSVTYGSVDKSACCSPRGPEFDSQHPHPAAPTCLY